MKNTGTLDSYRAQHLIYSVETEAGTIHVSHRADLDKKFWVVGRDYIWRAYNTRKSAEKWASRYTIIENPVWDRRD